jgi:ribonuclease HI
VARVSKFLWKQTNNWAEYEALILALDAAREACRVPAPRTEVRMDSELIVKQMNGEYKVKDAGLKKQHARVKNIIAASFPDISFTHVRREHNTEADALANDAMDRGR